MNQWTTFGLTGSLGWTPREMRVQYQGRELLLLPEDAKRDASVAIELTGISPKEGQLLVQRFLSALAWYEGESVSATFGVTTGYPGSIGKSHHRIGKTTYFRADYLPEPSDPDALLALALYREGLFLNSAPYQALSFFKVINIRYGGGREQMGWMAATLPKLTDHQARTRITELSSTVADISNYLYVSGRCAVAHAHGQPTVDPDDWDDHRRLSADLPVARALAAHLIEHELGVKSKSTILGEHLYELEGFSRLVSGDLIQKLKSGTLVEPSEIPRFPLVTLRLRDCPALVSLQELRVDRVDVNGGCLTLVTTSRRFPVTVHIHLQFDEERLVVDPERDLLITDDGSARAVKAAMDRNRFYYHLLYNAQIEVVEASAGALLGRTDPYLPVNIIGGQACKQLDRELERLRGDFRMRGEFESITLPR